VNVLYFAWLRQRTGTGQEEIALPDGVATVGDLVAWLKTRGPGYESAFSHPKAVRAAVNQEYVPFDHPLAEDDEVAFFPPITGG
jgi:molybdopterin synthase sulfur carrier subunit